MSELQKLINKLCPNGVEYVLFSDLCQYIRGITYNKSQEVKTADSNTWKVLRANNIILSTNTLNFDDVKVVNKDVKVKENQILKRNDILICAGSGSKEHIGKVAFISEDIDYTFGGFMAVIRCNNNLNSRFLFHYIASSAFKIYLETSLNSTTINNLNAGIMSNFKIPLLPLEIQSEIVRILDEYSEKNEKLIKELYAEIELRKKQYSYYRDLLLDFKTVPPPWTFDVERKTLGEIATEFYRGSGIKRDELTENGTPCIRYGEIYTTYGVHFNKCISYTDENNIKSKKYMEYGDILFAITGESVEDIAKSTTYLGKEKCLVGGDIVVMKHNQNPKYLSYALSTTNAKIQKSKGKIKSKVVHSNVSSIKEIRIPVPPIEVQSEIVRILDEYSEKNQKLIKELYAEIDLRKKQYTYYSDKLLTFKEVK